MYCSIFLWCLCLKLMLMFGGLLCLVEMKCLNSSFMWLGLILVMFSM